MSFQAVEHIHKMRYYLFGYDGPTTQPRRILIRKTHKRIY